MLPVTRYVLSSTPNLPLNRSDAMESVIKLYSKHEVAV